MLYHRLLKLDLPHKQSAFLWGARQEGKSTFLREHFPNSYVIDMLQSDVMLEFSKNPHLLREQILALTEEILAYPIIIDEVQKVPALLDEIHWLIENTSAYFILCGSSARKLKHGAANLLGGRAWRFEFFPLVSAEIPQFDLLKALNNGMLPKIYPQANARRFLHAYVTDYLKEEIQSEGLVQNLPVFARFLDSLAFTNGQLTNYTNIARDCGIDAKTVKAYYQILVDTLIGYYVEPYNKKVGRDILTSVPKFYLFDVGVAGFIAKRQIAELKGAEAGAAFEHFILLELMAYRSLYEQDFSIRYWRTKTGLEVDFILGEAEVAIEVKISQHVDGSELTGLSAFIEEHQPKRAIVVSLDKKPRRLIRQGAKIEIWPYQEFLTALWAKKII
jgi:predicted AAA+ superfamily ATPase